MSSFNFVIIKNLFILFIMNHVYPDISNFTRSESLMTIVQKNEFDENNLEFTLSKETDELYNKYLEEDSFIKDKIIFLKTLKSITNSNEIFNKHRDILKDNFNKRIVILKTLINRIISELNLFSNKLLLFPNYTYNIQDFNKILELKKFIDHSKKQISDNIKTYEF